MRILIRGAREGQPVFTLSCTGPREFPFPINREPIPLLYSASLLDTSPEQVVAGRAGASRLTPSGSHCGLLFSLKGSVPETHVSPAPPLLSTGLLCQSRPGGSFCLCRVYSPAGQTELAGWAG